MVISRGAARYSSSVRFRPPSRRRLNYIPLLLYRFLSSIYSLVTTRLRLHTPRINPLACSIRYFAWCNTHLAISFGEVHVDSLLEVSIEECGVFYRSCHILGIALQLLAVGVCFPKAGPLLGYARNISDRKVEGA